MANDFISTSVFFGVFISILAYEFGLFVKKKFKFAIFNPLLISIIIVLVVLNLFHISYEAYYSSAKYISYLLTPSTICLAIPLYEQFELLKKNWKAVLCGILAGVLTSLLSVFVLAKIFSLDHKEYVTFLPKSVTTAIGMGISEELNGYVPISVAVIIITGVIGNIIAELVFVIFRIEESVAKGVATGTSAHAIGTAKAIELGQVEGAISGLAIAVAGLLTVAFASLFASFM